MGTGGKSRGSGKIGGQIKLTQFAKASGASENRFKKRPSNCDMEVSESKRSKPSSSIEGSTVEVLEKGSKHSASLEVSTGRAADVRDEIRAEVGSRTVRPSVDILDPSKFGLGRYAEYHTRMLRILDPRRWDVRDATASETLCQLGYSAQGKLDFSAEATKFIKSYNFKLLPADVQAQLKMVHVVGAPEVEVGKTVKGRSSLLGRFDVVTFPVCADYDASFKVVQDKDHARSCSETFNGWFWVLHAAAPNIGENIKATDFCAYKRRDGSLDEDLYISDVERLWRTILKVVLRLGVEDAVVFPFGMGAFIRNLSLLDKQYGDEAKMRTLRLRLASCFAKSVSDICSRLKGSFRLHLCLVCVGSEDITNHNAFLEAIGERCKTCPELKNTIKLCRNVDAFDLSHRLAKSSSSGKEPTVLLLNGGNRELLGNHWFESGAVRAIDENIHRRSASMSRIALLLNDGTCTKPRSADELANRVKEFGGRVISKL